MAILDSGQIEVAIVAADRERSHWPLLRRARSDLRPQVVVGVGRVRAGHTEAELGPPLVVSRPLLAGVPTAYVCRDFACRIPVTDGPGLDRELSGAGIA
jgi:uncharacterized protein YyaL (SSP411 family)